MKRSLDRYNTHKTNTTLDRENINVIVSKVPICNEIISITTVCKEFESPSKTPRETNSDITPFFNKYHIKSVPESINISSNISSIRGSLNMDSAIAPKNQITIVASTERNLKPNSNKPPRPFLLNSNYLKPTQAFISRTNKDLLDEDHDKKRKHFRKIRGKGYQRDTKSRELYRHESVRDKDKRAKSAEGGRRWRSGGSDRLSNASYITSIANMKNESEREIEPFSLDVNEVIVKNEEDIKIDLLKKLEEHPTPDYLDYDEPESIYVYKAAKSQSLEFKKALPDLYSFIENYSKNINKSDKQKPTPRAALQELSIFSVKFAK